MNAIDEMSALNRDLKKSFDEHGADYPVWQALEAEAGRLSLIHISSCGKVQTNPQEQWDLQEKYHCV